MRSTTRPTSPRFRNGLATPTLPPPGSTITASRGPRTVRRLRSITELQALYPTVTVYPDHRFNKFIVGCASRKCFEFLLRELKGHKVHVGGLMSALCTKSSVYPDAAFIRKKIAAMEI